MSPETRTARRMGRVPGGSPDLTSRVTETRRLDGLHAADHEGVTPVMMMSFIFITRYSCWPPPRLPYGSADDLLGLIGRKGLDGEILGLLARLVVLRHRSTLLVSIVHGLGSGPPPKHLHLRRFLHDPCQGGRAPMWPKSREIRGRPALRPRAPRGGTPDAARRSARGDAPLPPTGSRFLGGGGQGRSVMRYRRTTASLRPPDP